MLQSRRITELASLIIKNTEIVDQYLESLNLPTPSLGINAPRKIPISRDAPEIERARIAVIEATAELRALMMGPAELLRPGYTDYVGLKAVTHFQIARAFPVGEEIAFGTLATKTGVEERKLRRLLRHAMTDYVFCEPREGVVAHNALSKLLAEDDLLHDCVCNALDELWPAASRVVEAIEKWPGSDEPNETVCSYSIQREVMTNALISLKGYSLANNTDKSMYVVFKENAARGEKFARAMSANTDAEGYTSHHLLEGYPWNDLGSALIVDVGGSQGKRRHRNREAIPQDSMYRTRPAARGRKRPTSDFFTPQPVSADLYYFRSIFRNWSDNYAIQILRHLVPALKPGARLLIHDFVVPEINALPPERGEASTLFSAYQRDEEEWVALLERADARFRMRGHGRPVGAAQSIVDVVWDADGGY
ncbi:MAG: hypothetical protein Q9227_001249 [Pyrenula ochraceoflavens]